MSAIRKVGRLALPVLMVASVQAWAAVPASGTLSLTSGPIHYDTGPNYLTNVASGTACLNPVLPCDYYTLTVDLPASYAAEHPDDVVKITWRWENAAEDYDFVVHKSTQSGAVVTQAGTASDPEVAYLSPVAGTYVLQANMFTVAGGTFHATIEVAEGTTAPVPPPAAGAAPQYYVYQSPAAGNIGSNEPNIGYNPRTRRAIFLASTNPLKVTFPPDLEPPLPLSCDATWESVKFAAQATSMDPIMFTDQRTGRTFVSHMISAILAGPVNAGANSLFSYTDDDGATWTQGQIGPPEGGFDHQSVGAGPYPASVPLGNPTNGGSAVYYCSQAGLTAFCSRSDDGGLTFPNGIPIYNSVQDGFGGLHGHIKVAPDGTVYVPSRACGEQQCVAVSEDAGINWDVRKIPNSTQGDTDPSVGIASDNTAYMCYTNGDGHPHVQVSHDRGLTWTDEYDIGASVGVKTAVFAVAVAGDSERAACAFIGTSRAGNHSAADFPGVWYPFVATTYDGGKNWHTVNASPADPVQREGGICTAGSSCGSNRNLLDFNEITMDEKGFPLFGYADGCTGGCVTGGTVTHTAHSRIARQVGGRPLFGQFDPPSAGTPGAACLSGSRIAASPGEAALAWRKPENGGSAITGYRVYRRAAGGREALLTQLDGTKTAYTDATADPAVAPYFYRVTAINANGEGVDSNTSALSVGAGQTGSPCSLPGLTLLTDASNDATSKQAGHELQSLSVSRPFAEDGDQRVVFRLKLASLASLTPSTQWFASFNSADGQAHGVRMLTGAQGAPVFQSYVATAAPNGGVVDGRYALAGSEKPAASGSGYSPSGEIVIAVHPADLGLAAGQSLSGFNAGVAAVATTPLGAGIAQSLDEMPSGLGRAGTFLVAANAACGVNTPPEPELLASVQTGHLPLTVVFTASGTDADGDALASFDLDFGDGQAVTAQPFGGASSVEVTHVYQDAGIYPARLSVTDEAGASSTSIGEKIIEVLGAQDQDLTPDAFGFIPRSNVTTNVYVTSETRALSGINVPVQVSVNSGQYRLNSGNWTSASGTAVAGDTIAVRHISAADPGATTTTTLTAGTYSTDFSSTTSSLDRTPDAFGFASQAGVATSTLIESNVITLAGYNTGVSVVAGPGASYRINGGAWTTASGTLQVGDTLQTRHTSSGSSLTYTKTYVKVGGVTGYFQTRTQ